VNLSLRLTGQTFRAHIHPTREVEARIQAAGFAPILRHHGWIWQTLVYRRA
jgi:hypothetical protein